MSLIEDISNERNRWLNEEKTKPVNVHLSQQELDQIKKEIYDDDSCYFDSNEIAYGKSIFGLEIKPPLNKE